MTEPQILGRNAPALADERTTLCALLDIQRATVVRKITGLTDEQARATPVPPSTITPMGLVKHLTAVERWWFSIDFAALDVPYPWPDGDVHHDGFELDHTDTVESVLAAYAAECDASRAVVDAAASLDEPARQPPALPFNLRYAIAHLIEETARHCGHVDLMREATDGATGE